jgi:hypothetical protein
MDITGCPEPGCGLPAEFLDRGIGESTDAPIEHASIGCLGGHRFLVSTELLPQRANVFGARVPAITFAARAGEPSSP